MLNTVNKPIRKKDAMSLLTGKPVYTEDLIDKNALVVKILHSPHANAIIDEINIDIKYDQRGQRIFLNGEDVSERIREKDVSIGASDVAVIPAVRLKLVEIQRELAKKSSVIMDGRDIGTYVLPDADVKIFLTASSDERARRRCLEMQEKGMDANFEEVKRDIEYRDKQDSSREFAPLKQADDAILVDSSDFEFEQTVEKILTIIKNKCTVVE